MIPEGYKGKFSIIFGQKSGTPSEYEDIIWRLYRVPSNGVLKTQFEAGNVVSFSRLKFYYVDKQGERVELFMHNEYENPYGNVVFGDIRSELDQYGRSIHILEFYIK